jgi:L-lactate dehydrogenase complex protein LldF
MTTLQNSIGFRENARNALDDAPLRASMRHAAETFAGKRTAAFASLPVDALRDKASEIRLHVLDNLPDYVDRFASAATRAGAVVHRAKDALTARETVAHILKDRGAVRVAKSKSMVTEEIHLNDHLEKQGTEVVETDLGEYIIQIANETPSHIIVPAIHKNRSQVGKLFADKLGVEYTDDPAVLCSIAREILREKFLTADAGISGANFAIAETGSLVLFTNEGNGRMVTTLPPLHIAILSIEKMIPKLTDLATFVRLLPRSATGQTLTSYLSLVTGTRNVSESTGAKELHIVLVDNGRSRILAGDCREMLKCIRCAACLNVCPVYRSVGGHAYGTTYPGPMGIVLSTLLNGIDQAHPLLDATTLCGACNDVCPVRVPLVKLLRILRERRVDAGLTPGSEKKAMAAFGMAVKSPFLFSMGQSMAKTFWPILGALERDKILGRLPKPSDRTFRRRMS